MAELNSTNQPSSPRYLALDVMRGLTVAAMITVNTPGSWTHNFEPFEHSKWHGCTPTDLVFPFFLFVVGISMFFSFSKYEQPYDIAIYKRIAKRTLLIFSIGLFINSFPQWVIDFSKYRIMAILQRIAIAYCVSSVLVLLIQKKYLPYLVALILGGYWWILWYFGGADPYSLNQNATLAFDRGILGELHLYRGFGIRFDPEGLLSTIPTLATVLLGYLTGVYIRTFEKTKTSVLKLASAGILSITAGIIWSLILPLNKPLWTPSYVLYSAGWALVVLALLIWIIDLKGYRRWTPFFEVFGLNPLLAFAASSLYVRVLIGLIHLPQPDGKNQNGYEWLYFHLFSPLTTDPRVSSLIFALTHMLLFWGLAYLLYRKKIVLKA